MAIYTKMGTDGFLFTAADARTRPHSGFVGAMRISIIVASRNAGPTIGRCLDSIAQQQHPNIETIVADGGSSDGTVDLLKKRSASRGTSLVWFSEPDSGIAEAWNKAVGCATGDWVLFLGADDRLASPDVLSRAAVVLEQALPEHRVVYGQVTLVATNGEEVGALDRPWSSNEFHNCYYNLPHQAVFHHRSLFKEFGKFDTSLTIAAAFDFLLRALAEAEPLRVPGLTVTQMQIGGLSNSRLNAPKLVLEEMRLFRRHVGGIPWRHAWWLVKAWGKYALYRLGDDRLALFVTNLYRRLVRGQGPLRY